MLIFEVSEESVVLQTENYDNINIFMQFFIHPNQNRHKEIRTCLIKNVLNKSISKIYLLNERIYTKEELGIDSNKICLLYTSPSPRDAHESRMPSSA